MTPTFLRCATLVVPDVEAAANRYTQWLNYSVVERGSVSSSLASSWISPASVGRKYAILQPSSLTHVYIRFIQGSAIPSYQPMRTYGWAATELCVRDVEAVNSCLLHADSPFKIIGAPKPLDGFPTVKPMQIRGPDQEIVYLTEILVDGPAHGLPEVESLVDRPFIMSLAQI
jgi:hypothetical protein